MTELTPSKRPLTGPAKLLVSLAVGVALLLPFLLQLRSRQSSQEAPAATSSQTPAASADPKAQELAMLQQHLSSKPDHTPMLLRMAQLERERGNPAKAAEYLRRVLDTESKNEEARLELGRALFEQGDAGAALEETRKLVAQNPSNVDALYNLGAIYGNLGNYTQAKKLFQQAVSIEPTSESGRLAREALARIPAAQTAR